MRTAFIFLSWVNYRFNKMVRLMLYWNNGFIPAKVHKVDNITMNSHASVILVLTSL